MKYTLTARGIALKVTALIAAPAFAAGFALGGGAPVSADTRPTTFWMQQTCKYEDSSNCFFDARREGNGIGHSYYTRTVKGKLCIFYIDRAYARKHDACWK